MTAFSFGAAPIRKAANPRNPYAIIRIAEAAAPEIQRAFLRAVAQVRNGTVLARVRDALERGDLRAAYDAIPWESVGERTLRDSLPKSLRDVYEQAANNTARRLSRDLSLSIRFDVTNPRAYDYIRNHTAQLIREFGASNRETIQYILERSFREGIPPYKAARMIRDSGIGLTTRQHIAVENMRRRLEDDSEVMLNDAQINSRAERYADRLLRYRTINIARTEVINASANAQTATWLQAREEGLLDQSVQVEWLAAESERTCEICMALDGERIPLGGTFPGGLSGPTAHPSCRCSTRLVFSEE